MNMKRFCIIIYVISVVLLLCSCTALRDSKTNDFKRTSFSETSTDHLSEKTYSSEIQSSSMESIMGIENNNQILSLTDGEGFPVVGNSEAYSNGSYYCITGCVPDLNVYNFDVSFVVSEVVSEGKTKDFEYAIHRNGLLEITKTLDNSKNITIPETINKHTVAYIGREAFKTSEAENVILPESIIAIGESAFYEAPNLKSIKLSNRLIAISAYAFYGCQKLNEIVLPDCLQAIGKCAFSGCKKLKTINMPDQLRIVGSEAFSSCNSLSGRLEFKKNLYSVASGAFEKTGIETVTFCDDVYEINAGAFTECSKLKEVILPKAMKDSENGLGWGMFANCTSLEKVNVPQNIIGLPSDFFYGCKALKAITIPASIESIGSDVFSGCTSLKDVYFESKDCDLYYNSFLLTKGLTVHAPKGGSVEKFFRLRPLVKFVATD